MLHPGPHPDAVKSRGEVQQRGQALAARNKKKIRRSGFVCDAS